ncbi:alpha/beta fold hydrolase [Agromyces aerolatus]|uniref:alpha/beta fold hydrolase n=1 Tax=Agromyces sp. LY-1074 TaxID=3074080 RepID=UPI0028594A58|nr:MULTISPECIES: alpha/beta hydrolase [unclassified Agromyces]MDR5698579.1 alpha/beta hydrolase [Agromyces sp. LY-1074]MDR5704873.1 alpha/beta hydrolase [Agromyces sp. LY-1358]
MHAVDPLVRNNVRVTGTPNGPVIVFAHAFGGSGESWRFVAPAFEPDHTVVVFDHVGVGGSDRTVYERAKYDSLHGYADDVIELIEALGLGEVTFVGHSVSAMIGMLAANQRPELFARLVMVGPSPRYLDDDGYSGGFTRDAVDELLDSLEFNYPAAVTSLSTVLMGYPERPELTAELAESITAADPGIAAEFARATFLSDHRRDLADVTVPTVILQSTVDNIAAPEVGRYVHEHIAGSRLIEMSARGHIPNLSDPAELIERIRESLA